MSTMSSRFSGKTYSRPVSKETYSSKAFDDIIKGKDNSKPPMARTTYGRWGHSSFTSARGGGGVTLSQPEPVVAAEPKRRKVESGLDDPFSFDSEDDLSPRKKNIVSSNNSTKETITAYTVNTAGQERGCAPIEDDDDDGLGSPAFKRSPVKSYSRLPNKNGTKSSSSSSTASGIASKTVQSVRNSKVQDKYQIPIDKYTTSLSKTAKTYEVSPRPATQSKTYSRTYTRKFFLSKNKDNAVSDSSPVTVESASPVVTVSQPTASSTSARTVDSSIWDSDDNSDISIPESGDPEIIFTPRKRKLGDSPGKSDYGGAPFDQQEEPDTADTPPSSPISELREAASRDHCYYSRDLLEDSTASADSSITAKTAQNATSKIDWDDHNYFSRNSTSTFEKDNDSSSNSSYHSVGTKKDPRRDYSKKTSQSHSSSKLSLLTKERSSTAGKKLDGPVIRKILTSPKKDSIKAVYNARSWNTSPPSNEEVNKKPISKPAGGIFDDLDEFDEDLGPRPPVLKKVSTWPLRKHEETKDNLAIKVNRQSKGLFTVVRNVKQAHECQEHGETQEFQDDIEYLLDGLEDSQSLSVRCLSTINVATKCKHPSFRMHLRAHGTLAKIFSALHDASTFPTLALCTSAVMYMMSRDRLNMDMDVETLHLMIQLLSVDPQFGSSADERAVFAEYERLRTKIRELCEQLDSSTNGTAAKFDLDTISTGTLAMETLLSLTSKRAGDWFKEEVRELRGLDHISDTVNSCMCEVNTDQFELDDNLMDSIRKVDRCLRVLENVTYLNPKNQNYLIAYKSSTLVKAMVKGLRLVELCLPMSPVDENPDDHTVNKESTGYALLSCLLASLSVLLNLTHDNEYGSIRIGQQPHLIPSTLTCVLQIPQFIPVDKRFDLYVLGLGLLINLVEHCDINRKLLVETDTLTAFDSPGEEEEVGSLQALVQMFLHREEAARRAEEDDDEEDGGDKKEEAGVDGKDTTSEGSKTSGGGVGQTMDPDASGMWQESEAGLEWVVIPVDEKQQDSDVELEVEFPNSQDEEEERFTKALHKAGRHMEDSIVAAYLALLIGCVLQDTSSHIEEVRRHLPQGDFSPLIQMLKKFLGFMNLTSAVGNTGGKSILRVIEILEAC